MSSELKTYSKGPYTLAETEKHNEFLFFRNDKEVLGNVGLMPWELFMEYHYQKETENGKHVDGFICSMKTQKSADGKVIKLITENCGYLTAVESQTDTEPEKPNFWKRMLNKILGK